MEVVSQEVQVISEKCDHGGVVRIGQTIVSAQLRWYRSTSCPNCGRVEEDGIGFPPEELRGHLIKGGGYWDVRANSANRSLVMKELKKILGLSNEKLPQQIRRFPIVFRGTKTEAEWVMMQLNASCIESSVIESMELP